MGLLKSRHQQRQKYPKSCLHHLNSPFLRLQGVSWFSPGFILSEVSGQREQKKDSQQSYSKDDPRSRDHYNYHTTPIPSFNNFQNSSRKVSYFEVYLVFNFRTSSQFHLGASIRREVRLRITRLTTKEGNIINFMKQSSFDHFRNRIWTTESTVSGFFKINFFLRFGNIWNFQKPSFVLNVRANSMERQNYDGPKQDSEKSLKRTSFSASKWIVRL